MSGPMTSKMMVDKAPDADTSATPPPANAVAGTRVSVAAGAMASWSPDGGGGGVACSVDNITTSSPPEVASTCGSNTTWGVTISATARSTPELSAPAEGSGTAGSTTLVATTSLLWACSANGSA